MENINDVYKAIKEAQKARDAEIDKNESALAASEKEKRLAIRAAEKALTDGSESEYINAKSLERTAGDKCDFYRSQLKKIKEAPLFSAEELSKIKGTIKREIGAERAEALQGAYKRVQAAIEEVDEYKNQVERAVEAARQVSKGHKRAIKVVDDFEIMSLAGIIQALNRINFNIPGGC